MSSFNKVILMGNLTRDPEIRYLPKGTAIAAFGLAVNRVWSNEAGDKKEECTFVDCEAWGRTAETIGQYLTKGKPLFIEGRLKLDQWDDKETGQKRSKMKVVVEHFQFIGGKREGDETAQEGPTTEQEHQQARPAQARKGSPAPVAQEVKEPGEEGGDTDSIPF